MSFLPQCQWLVSALAHSLPPDLTNSIVFILPLLGLERGCGRALPHPLFSPPYAGLPLPTSRVRPLRLGQERAGPQGHTVVSRGRAVVSMMKTCGSA